MFVKKVIDSFLNLACGNQKKEERSLWFLLTWVLLGVVEWKIIVAQGMNSPWALIIPMIFIQTVLSMWNDWLSERRRRKRAAARRKRNAEKKDWLMFVED